MTILQVSAIKILQSNAGYYLGRDYWDDECNCSLPYSRETEYYGTLAEAESALKYWEEGE